MNWSSALPELEGLTPDEFILRQWTALKETHSPVRAIASDLSRRLREDVTYDAVQKRIRAMKSHTPERGNFKKHWSLLCNLIDREVSKPLPKRKVYGNTLRKVAVLCDIHGKPNPAVVAHLISEKPNHVCLNGDIFDAVQFSRFSRVGEAPIADEIAAVRAAIELIIEKTGAEFSALTGNHDDRVRKYFEARIDPQFMPLVKYNLLELLAFGLEDSVRVVNTPHRFHDTTLTATFFTVLGDAIVGHAEASRKGELRTVDIFAEWLDLWRSSLGLPEPRLIVQAHVHRAGISYPRGGHQVRVEGGFSGDVSKLQYSMDGGIQYTPPVTGYTLFEQVYEKGLWRTVLPSVKFVMV